MKKEGGESSQGRSESSQGAVSLHIDMSVTLQKPEDWTEDWEASTFEVPSWEYIAERQLKNKYLAGDLNELVEGDMLAMQDRNCITEQWPRRVLCSSPWNAPTFSTKTAHSSTSQVTSSSKVGSRSTLMDTASSRSGTTSSTTAYRRSPQCHRPLKKRPTLPLMVRR